MKMRNILLIAIAATVLVVGSMSIFTVTETNQVIVLQFGNFKREIRDAGLKFKIPLLENIIYMDKRILSLDLPKAEVIASDEKRLDVDALVRFRISDPLQFFRAVQGNEAIFRQRLAVFAVANLGEVLGRAPFDTLLTPKRAALMNEIQDRVTEDAKSFGVEIVDVRIKRADLPETVSLQVFNRMRKEYNQQAAERRAEGKEEAQKIRANAARERAVIVANARRISEIKRGEGDGTAVKIFADAFGTDIAFFEFYRSMQAYQKAISRDDTMILSPDSEFFKFLGQGN